MPLKPSFRVLGAGVLVAALSSLALAQQTPMEELQSDSPNNWGKWGDDDQIGALNYLGENEVKSGAGAIRSGKYDVVVCNLANCDMVGHTGVMGAAVEAVETVDECVGKIVEATREMGGVILITADHGNADSMLLSSGSPNTAHTTNPVPLIISGADVELRSGRLADLAPTMLDLMGYGKPEEMTGESLIVK